MMMAIGLPGEMPRTFFEGPDRQMRLNMKPGEIAAPAEMVDGRPVAKPLPETEETDG